MLKFQICFGGEMSAQNDPDFAKRLRLAVDRFKSYLDAGMIDEVRKALAAKRISPSTLRIWIKDPKKLWTSYRRTEFADAMMDTLADLDQKRRNEAYEFALKELGVVRDGQRDLASYHGDYRVFHDFDGIELNNFAIRVEHSPFVVIFAFKYSKQNRRRGKCDGLIVLRHGRLVCAGFSPTTVFQAVFQCVGYPDRDLIQGMAFVDDLDAKEVRFSRIVIARDPKPAASSEAEALVRDSGRSL